jgi:Fic family protein
MACSRAVADAWTFDERAQQIEQRWRERLGRVRANSSADLILRSLPGMPVLTANSAAALIGRSFPAANSAVAQLVEAGILKQVNIGRRNRAFEAAEIIAAFADLERQLASPAGDTRKSVLRSM